MLQGLGPLLAIVIVAAGVAGGLVAAVPAPRDEVLADFDHAGHIERGFDCVDCHGGIESRAMAGVPSIQMCLEECHAEDVEKDTMRQSPNGRFILDHFERGEEPWWPKLYSLPNHVAFSHARHAQAGKVACEACHGDIASTTSLPSEPVETALTMDGCMACHERRGVSNDCFDCHK